MKPTYTELHTSLCFLSNNCPPSKFKDLSLETLQMAIDVLHPKDNKKNKTSYASVHGIESHSNDMAKSKKNTPCKYVKNGNQCPYKVCDYNHDLPSNDNDLNIDSGSIRDIQNDRVTREKPNIKNLRFNYDDKIKREIKVKQDDEIIIENISDQKINKKEDLISLTQYNDTNEKKYYYGSKDTIDPKKGRLYNLKDDDEKYDDKLKIIGTKSRIIDDDIDEASSSSDD
jgi:hypothetical protein